MMGVSVTRSMPATCSVLNAMCISGVKSIWGSSLTLPAFQQTPSASLIAALIQKRELSKRLLCR